jgi:hypothetical protein
MKFQCYDSFDKSHLLIIDYEWYAPLTDEIDAWCKNILGYWAREGMILTFLSSNDRMLFLLTWE